MGIPQRRSDIATQRTMSSKRFWNVDRDQKHLSSRAMCFVCINFSWQAYCTKNTCKHKYYTIDPECQDSHQPDTPQARFPDTTPGTAVFPLFVLFTQHLLVTLPPDTNSALNVQKLPPSVLAARSAQPCSVRPSSCSMLLLGPAL